MTKRKQREAAQLLREVITRPGMFQGYATVREAAQILDTNESNVLNLLSENAPMFKRFGADGKPHLNMGMCARFLRHKREEVEQKQFLAGPYSGTRSC